MVAVPAEQGGYAMTLKIVPLYAGLLGLLLIILSINVIRLRLRYRIGLGDGNRADVRQAMRVQGNFTEYVPLALVLLIALELMQGPPPLLHALGATLVVGRFAHAYGINLTDGPSIGRTAGVVATFSTLLISGLTAIGYATGVISP